MTSTSEGMLNCYRVLDIADHTASLCGKVLGDLGADVIKIEKPGGDPMRMIGPYVHNSGDTEDSLYWCAYNSGKRGITLDIENPEGRGVFRRLARGADLIIESSTPGHLKDLDLDYDTLRKTNPGLIMTSVTPFGQTGPKAHHAASDITLWAAGGQMYSMGTPDRPPVRPTFPPHSYLHAGVHAAVGSLIALSHRRATGEGQHVDVSIQEAVIASLPAVTEFWDLIRREYGRTGYTYATDTGVAKTYGMPCKDGYVTIFTLGGGTRASVQSLQQLVQMMDAEGVAPDWLKRVDWVRDYNTESASQELIDRVEKVLGDFLMTKTKKELYEETMKRSLLVAPFMDAGDVLHNPQLEARQFWSVVPDPKVGLVTYCGPFAQFSETPIKIRRATHIGEHNEEVYVMELDIPPQDIPRLKDANAV